MAQSKVVHYLIFPRKISIHNPDAVFARVHRMLLNGTDREIRASFHPLESATKQRLLPWSLLKLMRKTVFFFVLFHR